MPEKAGHLSATRYTLSSSLATQQPHKLLAHAQTHAAVPERVGRAELSGPGHHSGPWPGAQGGGPARCRKAFVIPVPASGESARARRAGKAAQDQGAESRHDC